MSNANFWVSTIIPLIAGLKRFKDLAKNLKLDVGLQAFQPSPSNGKLWKEGVKACTKLMQKNVQERLILANKLWQRYRENLEEVSKMKEKMLMIISKAIK